MGTDVMRAFERKNMEPKNKAKLANDASMQPPRSIAQFNCSAQVLRWGSWGGQGSRCGQRSRGGSRGWKESRGGWESKGGWGSGVRF